MPKYDVLLFDLVGVLVEINREADAVFLGWAQKTEAELWDFWLKSPAVRDFDTGRIAPEAFAGKLVAALDLPVSPETFMEVYESWLAGLYDGVQPLLKSLSQHYRLCCLSNINDVHWPKIRDEFGIGGLFEQYFLSHELGMLKPDTDVFQHVVNAVACPADRIVFFDDNMPNVRGAQTAGLHAYQARGLTHLKQQLIELGILDAAGKYVQAAHTTD